MVKQLKNRNEILEFINHFFGPDDSLEVESKNNEIILRKIINITEETKGTIKNLDINTIKQIAENEEFCGY